MLRMISFHLSKGTVTSKLCIESKNIFVRNLVQKEFKRHLDQSFLSLTFKTISEWMELISGLKEDYVELRLSHDHSHKYWDYGIFTVSNHIIESC